MKRFIGIIAIIMTIGLVIILHTLRSEPEEKTVQDSVLHVNVQRIQPQAITDIITGHGQVNPRWRTTISSEVNGRILNVSEKFLSGVAFNKGDILAEIDGTAYVATLKAARGMLATARRILKEEQQRAKIARENWESSGFTDQPSDLVLRKPQLEEAKTAIASAEASVNKAEYDLAQTQITAPYDGVVISRNINPGDFVQVGMEVGRVYDRRLYEAVIPLSAQKIARLSQGSRTQQVIISAKKHRNALWIGSVSRIEQVIDTQNRWQNVVIEISDHQGLLPGDFIRAEFQGSQYDTVLVVPENMPANDGYLWYVDEQERLQRFDPDVLFQKEGMLFVAHPFNRGSALNLTVGRNLFLPDVKVQANIADNRLKTAGTK